MKITNLTKVFGAVSILMSAALFEVMNLLISSDNERNSKQMLAVATVFVGIWFVIALAMLRKENKRGSKFNVGMLYHLIASVALIVSSVVAYLGQSKHFQAIDIAWAAGIGLVSLVVHLVSQKDSLKGIRKSEAFQ